MAGFLRESRSGRYFVLLAVGAAALAIALAARAGVGSGSLDSAFGKGGVLMTAIGPDNATAAALVIQPDGKLVAAGGGSFTGPVLARYNPDGSLDASFGSGGLVTTRLGSVGRSYALALQADGKLVALCDVEQHRKYFSALVRYYADGSVDSSFGRGGVVVVKGSGPAVGAYALLIQPDGKIVVADANFTIVRYKTNGSLDRSFGRGGIVVTRAITGADALAIQADGKLVAAGNGQTGPTLTRYTPNGRLDPSFGSGGIAKIRGGGFIAALAIQPDGKLILAGTIRQSHHRRFLVLRLTNGGSLDPGFGANGVVNTWIGAQAEADALVIQPDGKIVVGGYGYRAARFALARYMADGSLDRSFTKAGVVTTVVGQGSGQIVHGLVIQPDGKLVAAGSTGDPKTLLQVFALARYLG